MAMTASPARIRLAGMDATASPRGSGSRRCPRRWSARRAWREELGIGALYVKRDDLTGFAFAGNKARPLEFLLAAAIADGADTLVTGGAAGSNFCAATAAAALRAGLRCELVIAGDAKPPGTTVPALALAMSWGASVRWTGAPERESVDAGLPEAAAELAAAGARPYLIPRGGATGIGAVGYALAALELHEQLDEQGIEAGAGGGRGRLRRHPGRPGGRKRAARQAVDAGGRVGQPASRAGGGTGARAGQGMRGRLDRSGWRATWPTRALAGTGLAEIARLRLARPGSGSRT